MTSVSCPDESALAAFAHGDGPDAERAELEAHLDGCDDCARVLADLVRVFGGAPPVLEPPLASDETMTTAEGTADGDDWLAPGQRVGRFRILEAVGAGGMGIVYAAYDPQLDRRVALKLLRERELPGARDTDGSPRLLREAQALARLSHPNVVTVHDVGTLDDRLFLAMEFVDGTTLGAWLRQRQRSWSEIRGVFLAAGEGLAAAHAAGVVHRDFKPDNVLIDSTDRARVTDFGLARFSAVPSAPGPTLAQELDPVPDSLGRLTRTGALVGTPAYMAPEQFEGGVVDEASDQYSFCVALYEACFGRRPFVAKSLAELMLEVKEKRAPEPPRDAGVPAHVRAAVMRGLSRTKTERFAGMRPLLAVLGRRPARARWRAAMLGVPLGLVAVAATAYAIDASRPPAICRPAAIDEVWSEARRQAIGARFAATGRNFAADAWRASAQTADDYVRQWRTVQGTACETVDGEAASALRLLCLGERREQLRATLAVLERADVSLMAEAPRIVEALPDLDACVDVRRLSELGGEQPAPSIAARVLELRAGLAEAETLLRGGEYSAALERVDALTSDVEALAFLPVTALHRLHRGRALQQLGRYDDARSDIERASELATASGHRRLAAEALLDLLFVLAQSGTEVELGHYVGGQTRSELTNLGDPPRLVSRWHELMAGLHRGAGDPAEALEEMTLALHSVEAAGDPLEEARVLLTLAQTEVQSFRFDDAHGHLVRAREIVHSRLGPDHPEVATVEFTEGILAAAKGEWTDAERHLEEAVRIRSAAVGTQHPVYATESSALADVYAIEGDFDRAIPRMQEAVAASRASVGEQNITTLNQRLRLARLYHNAGRSQEALDEAGAVVDLAQRILSGPHHDVAAGLAIMGRALLDLGRPAEAVHKYEAALATNVAVYGERHTYVGVAHGELGVALLAAGRPRDAIEAFTTAIEQAEGDELAEPERPWFVYQRARARHALGEDPAAVAADALQAAEDLEAVADPDRAGQARAWAVTLQ